MNTVVVSADLVVCVSSSEVVSGTFVNAEKVVKSKKSEVVESIKLVEANSPDPSPDGSKVEKKFVSVETLFGMALNNFL